MPTDDDLRRELAATPVTGTLDADRIIARSRARRRPRQVASGLVGALALTGVLVVAVQTLPPSGGDTAVMMESAPADDSASATSGGSAEPSRAGWSALATCDAPGPTPTSALPGVTVELSVPASSPVGTGSIAGVVRITNDSLATIDVSTTSTPWVVITDAGTVVWHTNGASLFELTTLPLAPGTSTERAVTLSAVRCTADDELLSEFPADLPPLPAGTYGTQVAVEVTDPTTGLPNLLVSEPIDLTIG